MRTCIVVGLALTAGCGRLSFDPRDTVFDDAGDGQDTFTLVLGPACPADPSLLACWDFELSAMDRTGRGNDATLTNAAFVAGIDGLALRMDATSRADLATPNLGAVDFTIEGWVSPQAVHDRMLVFDHDSHFGLSIEATGVLVCDGFGDTSATGVRVIPPGWHHIACAYDGTTQFFTRYFDGEVDGGTTVGMIPPGSGAAAIGGNAPPQQEPSPYLGDLDRLRIWNRELTPSEIATAAGR